MRFWRKSYYRIVRSIESLTNLNEKFSSFYNAKEELCRDERKHIEDRENEIKPTKTFETVNEGFYQGEEEENTLKKKNKPIYSRKNL